MDELPIGWTETTLAKVVAQTRPKAAPSDHPDLPFVGMDQIASNGMTLLGSVKFGEMKSNGGLFFDGDVLYGKMRPYLNKVHRAKFSGACSAEFIVFPKSKALDSDFLAYLLHHRKFVNFASGLSSGDRPRVDFGDLSDYPVLLPPANEQRRIVSKIEELFSQIEEGEHALQLAQKLVERYRLSVLKAAVTGELTRDWRSKHKANLESGEALLKNILKAHREAWEKAELDKMKAKGQKATNDHWNRKYHEPGEIATDYLGTLPSEWQKVRIDTIGEVQLGRQRAPQHHGGKFMRPYLRVANVFEERIDTDDVMTMNFTPDEFQTYALRNGDILLNEGQSKELIGRPAIYRDELPGVCFTNTLVRLRATAAVLPEFALLTFLHYMKSGDFQKIAKITTNIAHLGAGRFSEMSFPVPVIEEQQEIVDRVNKQSSVYAHLIEDVAGRQKQVSNLRQSVLKSAFAGSLVAQDDTDEPASTLLERIAAERNASTPAKRQRGRQKKRTTA